MAVREDIVDAIPDRHVSVNGVDNEAYLLNLDRGGYVDAEPHVLSTQLYSNSSTSALPPPRHPLAVGHIVNHPPRGSHANTMTKSFFWEDTHKAKALLEPSEIADITRKDYMQLCPTRWGRGAWFYEGGEKVTIEDHFSPTSTELAGIALYTLETVHSGDELFHDYKLSGNQPDWYHAPSKELPDFLFPSGLSHVVLSESPNADGPQSNIGDAPSTQKAGWFSRIGKLL